MPAYMVAQYRSLKEYDAYRKAAIELNRKHGARVLTKAGTSRCVEGEWPHENLVIIEFDSMEAAEKLLQGDPFHQNGIFVRWVMRPWNPTLPSSVPRSTRPQARRTRSSSTRSGLVRPP